MKTHPIEPITLKTTDGQERGFLLTRGALRRIRAKLGVKTLQEVLGKVATDDDGAMGVLLYECLLVKGELSFDQFEDIMPFGVNQSQSLLAEILNVSLPGQDSERPTVAPLNTIQ